MKTISITLFFSLCMTGLAYSKEELISIQTREDITLNFLLLEPDKPVSSVILFTGGHGNLTFTTYEDSPKIKKGKNNFLVRSRYKFVEQQFNVIVIDAPSDRESKNGMFGGFRNSKEHVEDIDYVIAFLRKRFNMPIWLIGTSRGTESATYATINSNQSPAGLVLTSSMTEENKKGIPISEMALEQITTPVLIVAHEDDECWVTQPLGAEDIKEKLVRAKKVVVKYFEGGIEPKSRSCGPLSPHGFYGIEKEVIAYISNFIKQN